MTSSFLQPLLEWLEHYSSGYASDAELVNKLTKALSAISGILVDAEDKQKTSTSVQKWLEDVEDTIYDVDDLVDEIASDDVQRLATVKSQPPTTWKQIREFFPSLTKSTTPKPIGKQTKTKINSIVGRLKYLEHIASTFLGLEKSSKGAGRSEACGRIHSRTSLVDDDFIVGRDEDKENIVKMLLSDDVNRGVWINAISILGMAGSGKTTLAQLAFNDERVESYFDARAWVCVGDEFDSCKVRESIVGSVTGQIFDNEAPIGDRLEDCLVGKRFLIVLDDICFYDHNTWKGFRTSLLVGEKGSKIVISTRVEDVAKNMSTTPYYHLNNLNNDDCWSLFAKHAFGNQSPSSRPDLVGLGKDIARKCSGLPLAAKVVGGLLSSKVVEEWKAVLNDTVWNYIDNLVFMPLLRLSYTHLPANLKLCFSYCSLFPRNYEFEKEKLIRMWMAEGFLEQLEGKTEEDVGDYYFHDLMQRSFLQRLLTNKSRFVMHDLISDLAQFVSKEFHFRSKDASPYTLSQSFRRVSCTGCKHDPSTKNISTFLAAGLRTLLSIYSPSDHKNCHLVDDVLQNSLVNLPRLRVLSLPFYNITAMPYSIGKLKHLRYLDLSHTTLKSLPESVTSLYNLQTLDLSYCQSLIKLPEDMWKLLYLRHLLIRESGVQEMPLKMSRLTNLQTLSNFILSKSGAKIVELPWLSQLRGALSISRLENLRSDKNVFSFILNGMYIDELELKWSGFSDDPQGDENVLENLVPSTELKGLVIESYSGKKFPSWLHFSSFSKIVFLRLSNCKNCLLLPPIGRLPSLEVLEIKGLGGITSLGPDIFEMNSSMEKPFQSLKILKFDSMSKWEEWKTLETEDGGFPSLEELHIANCPCLRGDIPNSIRSLKKLVISECRQLLKSLHLPVSFRCIILIDGKRVKPRCNDEDASPVTSDAYEISSLKQEASHKTALGSTIIDIASQRPLKREAVKKKELGDLVNLISDQPNAVCSYSQSSESSKAAAIDKLLSAAEIPNQSKKIISHSNLDSAIHVVASESTRDMSRTTTEVFHSYPGSSRHYHDSQLEDLPSAAEVSALPQKIASETTLASTSSDVDAQSSLQMTRTTGITYQNNDEAEPVLSTFEMQYQYSSPGIFTVSDISQLGKLSPDVHSLRIEGCEILGSLPFQILSRNPSILHLYVIDCGFSLIRFAESAQSTSLKTLHIQNCRKLEFPSTEEMMNQCADLEHLCIGSSCESLESFPLNLFQKLEILSLWDCMKLKDLSIEEKLPRKDLEALESLEIRDCPNLIAFLGGRFSAPHLTSIIISNCNKLKCLPRQMRCLESLRSLFISKCQELNLLPEDGLPESLNLLCITSCDNITPNKEWKLSELDALTHFEIEGGCKDINSFPEEGLLPKTLIQFRISRLPDLKHLDQKGLQQLTSLEKLEINCCKKLRHLPQELPSSLSFLSIKECPPLKAKLQKKHGIDWSRIADIPTIFVDDVEIH